MKIWSMIFLLLTSGNGMVASAQTKSAPPETPATIPDNDEMKAIFIADETDRGNYSFVRPGDPRPRALTGAELRKNTNARDVRVREMLDAGLLHTGIDYFRAANVFQHSGIPSETLLAHVLASVAVAKGNPGALWLSAATLDRYLAQINQKQIFGTQFKVLPGQTKPPYSWEQNEVEPDLISDSLRAEFCTAPLSAQKKGLPGPPAGTSLFPCPAAQAEMKNRIAQKSN
jgi:hypothetical protein